ncbi:MAG: GTPase Era [Spirochaetota bacterium]
MSEPVSKADGPETPDERSAAPAKSAFVAVIGRPSAGKSTILNALCGHKVAIVAPVPQTTRNRIRGIVNRARGQLVFIDTPGYHTSSRTFNRHMRGLIEETIRDAEEILYVVDAARQPGEEELELMRSVAGHAELPRVVAVNKTDVARADRLEAVRLLLSRRLPDIPVVEVSAKTGDGLDALLDALYEHAPAGEPAYPDDFYTDQPPDFRISEVIRQHAMAGLREELPHSIYVDVLDMEIHDLESGEKQLWIRAVIFVERSSQQGMIVGRKGSGIKRIRQAAQKEIASLFPYRIHLDLRVKVDPNWSRNDRVLDRLVQ